MEYRETELTDEVLRQLMRLSADWEAEGSCYGYRANEEADIAGNRIFLCEDGERIIAYLFGHRSTAKNMSSILQDGTPFFEAEELYVIPSRRSEGIGSALFRFAAECLTETDHILLSTATKNWKAILHFYIEELGMEFWSARLYKKLR